LHAHERALRAAVESAGNDQDHGSALLKLARKESLDLAVQLERFRASSGKDLPAEARADLADLAEHRKVLTDISSPAQLGSASSVLAFKLASLDYNMSDRETRSRRLVDRAFLHLDRLLVVDQDVRRKWQEAFKLREPDCERLGGVHLLQHGIWAFKADGSGARTDLVLGTPMSQDDLDFAAATVDVLTLTEWKVARTAAEVEGKYQEAVSQLRSYAAGVLAGVELQSVRYAVTVGSDRADLRADSLEGAVVFRHVHIAVAPSSPSKVSRMSAQARGAQVPQADS
jgi:hypothetical protein